jgi:hypothetical protein
MEEKKEKVALNDELLDKVAGGIYFPSSDYNDVKSFTCTCKQPFPDPNGVYCTSCGQSLR